MPTCAAGATSVVGINLPTFVERDTSDTRDVSCLHVSSGLTSRPSLSVPGHPLGDKEFSRVVGINLPTFVERHKACRMLWKKAGCRRD